MLQSQDNGSHHKVSRGIIKNESALKRLAHPAGVPLTVFQKKDSRLASQEEAAFSALYQADIGRSAARTVHLGDESEDNILGVVSVGLKRFLEYGRLWDKSSVSKYNEGNDVSLLSDIFKLDRFGKPVGFKVVKGLAGVLLSSWLYAEDDLHKRNFGISRSDKGEYYWSRLDFGMSLASITHGQRLFRTEPNQYNAITLRDLQTFPVLTDAAPFYFPTVITSTNSTLNPKSENKYTLRDKELFATLVGDEDFIKEKHEWLLKQFLILIEKKRKILTDNIDEPRASRLAVNIENRILTLQWTALCDEGFRKYVKQMARGQVESLSESEYVFRRNTKSELWTLFEEITQDEAQAFNLKKAEKPKSLIGPFLNLFRKIHLIDKPVEIADAIDFDKDEVISQIFTLDLDIETTQSKLRTLNKRINTLRAEEQVDGILLADLHDCMDKRPGLEKELNQHIAKREGLFNAILRYAASKGEPQKGLEDIQYILARRATLAPINTLIADYGSKHSIPKQTFFQSMRENWFLPRLKKLPETLVTDELYQTESVARLRNIKFLCYDIRAMLSQMVDSDANDFKKAFADIFRKYDNHVTVVIDKGEVTANYLRQMEKALVELKYRLRFNDLYKNIGQFNEVPKADRSTESRAGIFNTPGPNFIPQTFYDVRTLISQVIEAELPLAIRQCFDEKRSSSDVPTMQLIKSLKNLQALFVSNEREGTTAVFDIALLESLDAERNADIKQRMIKACRAISKLNGKLSSEQRLNNIQFILSRLALDIAIMKAEHRLEEVDIPDELEGENKHHQYQQLISTNKALSKALAYPEYHDTLQLSDVAHAAILGAEVLARPSEKTASRCIIYAETLSKSHQTRLATKVATALAVVGAIALAALAIFFWPASVTSLGLILGWGIGGGLTLGSATYAGYRFFRDRDKVQRKLEDVGQQVLNELQDEPAAAL